jgi:hypothetical protein
MNEAKLSKRKISEWIKVARQCKNNNKQCETNSYMKTVAGNWTRATEPGSVLTTSLSGWTHYESGTALRKEMNYLAYMTC